MEVLLRHGLPVPAFVTVDSDNFTLQTISALLEKQFKSCQYFAVRSSAHGEDSQNTSCAGKYYSATGATRQQVFQECQKVLASYAGSKGGIIIQEFISCEKSGVIFSNAGQNLSVVNANFGLCESVVQGKNCDQFVLMRSGKILRERVVKEKKFISLEAGRKVCSQSENKTLSEKELKLILSAALEIERIFSAPQDIEWGLKNNQLYIFQARPITKNIFSEELEYFDSANISESYSGIVLPLTCSFASLAYEVIYKNLIKYSGGDQRMMAKHEKIFQSLLGFHYGRMYYNMGNWYKMMAFIPGYERNKGNFELMISSNVKEGCQAEIAPSPLLKISYPLILLGKSIFHPINIALFENRTRKLIRQANAKLDATQELKPLIDFYHKLRDSLLKDWHIAIENDFLTMTLFGALQKSLKNQPLGDKISFHNVSAQQVEELTKLAALIKAKPELSKVVAENNERDFNRLITLYPEIKLAIQNYKQKYQGRSASDLKLESPDLNDDFSSFAKLINLYARQGEILRKGDNNSNSLSLLIFLFKKAAQTRETQRLLRSNVFAIFKKLFRKIGSTMQAEGLLENPDDIFYFQLEEISNPPAKIKELIKRRKEQYAAYHSLVPQKYFAITSDELAPLEKNSPHCDKKIFALPCSPGKISGRIKIFHEFELPQNIDFDIAVAKNTDPGWTPLFGLVKGLIVENGGMLSHAAIVSRELGIPAVIGAENALNILKDGQVVEINGNIGEISVIQ